MAQVSVENLGKPLNISYIGAGRSPGSLVEGDLLLLILQKVSGRKVVINKNWRDADLILVYPYISGQILFRLRWVIAAVVKKCFKVGDCTKLFRWLLGVANVPVLFVSHENLDRPFWWKMFGNFLVQSDIPRLTFWPKQIDSRGCRFPYWYNYVMWDEYPRIPHYPRFGRFYKISELMEPPKCDPSRKDLAVLISSHLDHPRDALVKAFRMHRDLDIYGGAGLAFQGSKLDIMKDYKFAFCVENSVGFGYDTEKLPEAWVAGCVPLGVYLNPFSDFNPAVVDINPSDPTSYARVPLLKTEPSLDEIEAYVKKEFF